MELNLKIDEQLLTKVCNKMLDEYEYNGKTIREWADRISNPKTNGDNVRAMTDEELAEWFVIIAERQLNHVRMRLPTEEEKVEARKAWLEWLKRECEP